MKSVLALLVVMVRMLPSSRLEALRVGVLALGIVSSVNEPLDVRLKNEPSGSEPAVHLPLMVKDDNIHCGSTQQRYLSTYSSHSLSC